MTAVRDESVLATRVTLVNQREVSAMGPSLFNQVRVTDNTNRKEAEFAAADRVDLIGVEGRKVPMASRRVVLQEF